MEKITKDKWFKSIISIAVLIVALSIAYYYIGYLPSHSELAISNHNPGLLKDSSGKIIYFDSPQNGYAALLNSLQAMMDGKSTTGLGPNSTLCDYSNLYASTSGNTNNTGQSQYCINLASQLNVSPNATLGSLQSRIGNLADAIANNNGFVNH